MNTITKLYAQKVKFLNRFIGTEFKKNLCGTELFTVSYTRFSTYFSFFFEKTIKKMDH
jgi:hypothetical protein